MRTPFITIAIPTYNREEVLIDTITDALAQSEKNLEVIVVDQSQSHKDSIVAALNSLKDDVRLRHYYVDPPSVTAARNFALRHAQSPFVLFLDDDVRLDKDLAKNFLKAFKTHPDVSAMGGRVNQKGFPVLDEILSFDDYTVSHGVFTSPKSGYTNAFAGGNCCLKVEDALAVGGFDTRYYGNAFREESDMSLKLVKAGYKIWYESSAQLLHLAAPYGGNRVKGHIYDRAVFYRNELFFTLRHTKKGNKLRALRRKYREYCKTPQSETVRFKRTCLFFLGFIAVAKRMLFDRQRVAVERKS